MLKPSFLLFYKNFTLKCDIETKIEKYFITFALLKTSVK